jgi:AraC-like DNA-binding protein
MDHTDRRITQTGGQSRQAGFLTARAFRHLCQARDLLRATWRPVTIRDAAAAAAMSPFHFIRRFQALFGDTPHQLHTRARIERAKRLLALTDRSVTAVCFDVGFSSLGSFSTLFRQRVGASPSAYRARLRAHVSPSPLPAARADALREVIAPGCLTLMGAAFAIVEKRQERLPRHTAATPAPLDTAPATRGSTCASS